MDSCSIIIKFWLFQQHLTNYTVVTQTVPVESKKKCSSWNHFAIVFHQAKQSRLAKPLQSSSLSVCTISAVARRRCCGAPCRRCSAAIATWLATRTILRTASLSSSTKRSATCDRQPPGCRRHQYREQRRHRWRRSDLVRRLRCVASLCSRHYARPSADIPGLRVRRPAADVLDDAGQHVADAGPTPSITEARDRDAAT